jgi:hypothetical protein
MSKDDWHELKKAAGIVGAIATIVGIIATVMGG